ncbi:hypothetical protein B484DRAFT_397615 [Ochromonadaceae sp. CCMP2298]|nr:hypothetical protein B484DRAFT_397615 [Ochromonadaceae sp. CCMP2298]
MCGLSRKQLYRRQFQRQLASWTKAAHLEHPPSSVCLPESVQSSSECDSAAAGDPQAAGQKSEVRDIGQRSEAEVSSVMARRVSFNNFIGVILIPSIGEYTECGMYDSLWWSPADYVGFKEAAIVAFRGFVQHYGMTDKRKALRLFSLAGEDF